VSKYGAVRTQADGYTFDSKREAERYAELKLLQRADGIGLLLVHPRFRLEVNGYHVGDYVADFQYIEGGANIVEDVKGYKTPIYQLKRKLMWAIHKIAIKETK